MRRTPLEIKKQSFTKSLRGYEPDEVRSFLSTLSDEWEEMIRENRQLKKEISGLSETLKHYKKVEEALQETLQTAKTDRKSTRLNSSHVAISYAVFCLKKK